MPFRSRAQQRYLFAKHPDIAKRFAAETPASTYKKLPEHAGMAEHLVRGMMKKRKRST